MSRESRHLKVFGLPENCTDDVIKEYFNSFGKVQRVESVKIDNKTNGHKNSTIVSFIDMRSAANALVAEKLELKGQLIKVAYHDNENTQGSLSGSNKGEKSGKSSNAFPLAKNKLRLLQESSRESSRSKQSVSRSGSRSSRTRSPQHSKSPRSPPQPAPANTANKTRPAVAQSSRHNSNERPGLAKTKSSRSTADAGRTSNVNASRPRRLKPPTSTANDRHANRFPAKHRSLATSGDRYPKLSSSHHHPNATTSSSFKSSGSGNQSSGGGSGGSRHTAVLVRNLPLRSTDSSLKDGLFFTYKKHGKVSSVKVVGEGPDRYAVVTFRRNADIQKAIESTNNVMFFGSRISVEIAPINFLNVDDNERRPLEKDIDQFHPKSSRTLYVGNLENRITMDQLRHVFQRFGDIVDIDIKNRETPAPFAFVQFTDILSVVKAIHSMEQDGHIGNNRVKVGFGKPLPSPMVWMDELPDHVSSEYLSRKMNFYGSITDVLIDKLLHQALITYDCIEAAQNAVQDMKGRTVCQRKVQIDFCSRELHDLFVDRMFRTNQLRGREAAVYLTAAPTVGQAGDAAAIVAATPGVPATVTATVVVTPPDSRSMPRTASRSSYDAPSVCSGVDAMVNEGHNPTSSKNSKHKRAPDSSKRTTKDTANTDERHSKNHNTNHRAHSSESNQRKLNRGRSLTPPESDRRRNSRRVDVASSSSSTNKDRRDEKSTKAVTSRTSRDKMRRSASPRTTPRVKSPMLSGSKARRGPSPAMSNESGDRMSVSRQSSMRRSISVDSVTSLTSSTSASGSPAPPIADNSGRSTPVSVLAPPQPPALLLAVPQSPLPQRTIKIAQNATKLANVFGSSSSSANKLSVPQPPRHPMQLGFEFPPALATAMIPNYSIPPPPLPAMLTTAAPVQMALGKLGPKPPPPLAPHMLMHRIVSADQKPKQHAVVGGEIVKLQKERKQLLQMLEKLNDPGSKKLGAIVVPEPRTPVTSQSKDPVTPTSSERKRSLQQQHQNKVTTPPAAVVNLSEVFDTSWMQKVAALTNTNHNNEKQRKPAHTVVVPANTERVKATVIATSQATKPGRNVIKIPVVKKDAPRLPSLQIKNELDFEPVSTIGPVPPPSTSSTTTPVIGTPSTMTSSSKAKPLTTSVKTEQATAATPASSDVVVKPKSQDRSTSGASVATPTATTPTTFQKCKRIPLERPPDANGGSPIHIHDPRMNPPDIQLNVDLPLPSFGSRKGHSHHVAHSNTFSPAKSAVAPGSVASSNRRDSLHAGSQVRATSRRSSRLSSGSDHSPMASRRNSNEFGTATSSAANSQNTNAANVLTSPTISKHSRHHHHPTTDIFGESLCSPQSQSGAEASMHSRTSFEERIRALDDKFVELDRMIKVTKDRPAHRSSVDYSKYKVVKKVSTTSISGGIPGTSEFTTSKFTFPNIVTTTTDISSTTAKLSIFDQDAERLSAIEEKYAPKLYSTDQASTFTHLPLSIHIPPPPLPIVALPVPPPVLPLDYPCIASLPSSGAPTPVAPPLPSGAPPPAMMTPTTPLSPLQGILKKFTPPSSSGQGPPSDPRLAARRDSLKSPPPQQPPLPPLPPPPTVVSPILGGVTPGAKTDPRHHGRSVSLSGPSAPPPHSVASVQNIPLPAGAATAMTGGAGGTGALPAKPLTPHVPLTDPLRLYQQQPQPPLPSGGCSKVQAPPVQHSSSASKVGAAPGTPNKNQSQRYSCDLTTTSTTPLANVHAKPPSNPTVTNTVPVIRTYCSPSVNTNLPSMHSQQNQMSYPSVSSHALPKELRNKQLDDLFNRTSSKSLGGASSGINEKSSLPKIMKKPPQQQQVCSNVTNQQSYNEKESAKSSTLSEKTTTKPNAEKIRPNTTTSSHHQEKLKHFSTILSKPHTNKSEDGRKLGKKSKNIDENTQKNRSKSIKKPQSDEKRHKKIGGLTMKSTKTTSLLKKHKKPAIDDSESDAKSERRGSDSDEYSSSSGDDTDRKIAKNLEREWAKALKAADEPIGLSMYDRVKRRSAIPPSSGTSKKSGSSKSGKNKFDLLREKRFEKGDSEKMKKPRRIQLSDSSSDEDIEDQDDNDATARHSSGKEESGIDANASDARSSTSGESSDEDKTKQARQIPTSPKKTAELSTKDIFSSEDEAANVRKSREAETDSDAENGMKITKLEPMKKEETTLQQKKLQTSSTNLSEGLLSSSDKESHQEKSKSSNLNKETPTKTKTAKARNEEWQRKQKIKSAKLDVKEKKRKIQGSSDESENEKASGLNKCKADQSETEDEENVEPSPREKASFLARKKAEILMKSSASTTTDDDINRNAAKRGAKKSAPRKPQRPNQKRHKTGTGSAGLKRSKKHFTTSEDQNESDDQNQSGSAKKSAAKRPKKSTSSKSEDLSASSGSESETAAKAKLSKNKKSKKIVTGHSTTALVVNQPATVTSAPVALVTKGAKKAVVMDGDGDAKREQRDAISTTTEDETIQSETVDDESQKATMGVIQSLDNQEISADIVEALKRSRGQDEGDSRLNETTSFDAPVELSVQEVVVVEVEHIPETESIDNSMETSTVLVQSITSPQRDDSRALDEEASAAERALVAENDAAEERRRAAEDAAMAAIADRRRSGASTSLKSPKSKNEAAITISEPPTSKIEGLTIRIDELMDANVHPDFLSQKSDGSGSHVDEVIDGVVHGYVEIDPEKLIQMSANSKIASGATSAAAATHSATPNMDALGAKAITTSAGCTDALLLAARYGIDYSTSASTATGGRSAATSIECHYSMPSSSTVVTSVIGPTSLQQNVAIVRPTNQVLGTTVPDQDLAAVQQITQQMKQDVLAHQLRQQHQLHSGYLPPPPYGVAGYQQQRPLEQSPYSNPTRLSQQQQVITSQSMFSSGEKQHQQNNMGVKTPPHQGQLSQSATFLATSTPNSALPLRQQPFLAQQQQSIGANVAQVAQQQNQNATNQQLVRPSSIQQFAAMTPQQQAAAQQYGAAAATATLYDAQKQQQQQQCWNQANFLGASVPVFVPTNPGLLELQQQQELKLRQEQQQRFLNEQRQQQQQQQAAAATAAAAAVLHQQQQQQARHAMQHQQPQAASFQSQRQNMVVQQPQHAAEVSYGQQQKPLLERYPVIWQGYLALKNDNALVQMHLVSGNPQLLPHSLPVASEHSSIPVLRIMQRMRLEAQQLDGVRGRMQLRDEHCILVVLPCGQDRNHIIEQSTILNSAFITYLQQKQAAGIVHIIPPGSTQPAYIVHVFPPCEFAQQTLISTACDFFQSIIERQTSFLFVVVTTAQGT